MSEWKETEGAKVQDCYRALVGWDKIHRWVVTGEFVEGTGKWHDDFRDEPFYPQPTHFMPLPSSPK